MIKVFCRLHVSERNEIIEDDMHPARFVHSNVIKIPVFHLRFLSENPVN